MRVMRRARELYYQYKIPVDAAVNSVVTFSAVNTIIGALIDSEFEYKQYFQWGIAAGMTLGSFAATFSYYRRKQGNIVHADSLYEIGSDLDHLAQRLNAKYKSRSLAILKIEGLAGLIPEQARPLHLIESLRELRYFMEMQSICLMHLKATMNTLHPSIKPIMFASGVGQGYGYSLLVNSVLNLILGSGRAFELPFLLAAGVSFLAGTAWNIRKEYCFERSREFFIHYGEISHDLQNIHKDFDSCEQEIAKSLEVIAQFFEHLDLRQLSSEEIYSLYLPLMESISVSGDLSRASFKGAYHSENPEDLKLFFQTLSAQFRWQENYKENPIREISPKVIISEELEFQMPREESDLAFPPRFSIHALDEESPLLPSRNNRSLSISRVAFLLYKIPEGGYPLLEWLMLANINRWVALVPSAGLGGIFAGLKLARCRQFEKLLNFNPESLKRINIAIKNHNKPMRLSEEAILGKISEILDDFFSEKNLGYLSEVFRNSSKMQSIFQSSNNRNQFWATFTNGDFQFENDIAALEL